MKRICRIIIMIIISLVCFVIPYTVFGEIDDIKEKKSIENSLPTENEIDVFNDLLSENTMYYYNQLDENDKKSYVAIYSSFMSFDESVVVQTDEKTLNNLFMAVLYDNPHIFWIEHQYEYVINKTSLKLIPKYCYNETEAKIISEQINKKIEQIVSAADKLSDDFEKELYIHDYVCLNTVYDDAVDGNSVYDVLIKGRAVCEGYSKTIQILLDALDIDNYLVTGESVYEGELGPHMWNIVNIDGMNYHLDSTWNDNDKDNEIHYFYFNVSDSVISEDHFSIFPSNNNCISDSAYYYSYNNSVFSDFNGFYEHTERSAEILRNGENEVEFIFENSDDYENAILYIENNNGFFNYVCEAGRKSGRKINTTKISYITIKEHNYLSVIFKEG